MQSNQHLESVRPSGRSRRWLDLALRYLLDALRSQPGSKLSTFARSSLLHCRSALRTWPTYCSLLLQVCCRPSWAHISLLAGDSHHTWSQPCMLTSPVCPHVCPFPPTVP